MKVPPDERMQLAAAVLSAGLCLACGAQDDEHRRQVEEFDRQAAQFARQAADFDRQTAETDRHLAKLSEQAERYDKILERWDRLGAVALRQWDAPAAAEWW